MMKADSTPRDESAITEPLAMLIDIGTLAQHLGVNERFVRRLVEEHRLPFHKIGKFVRFHPDDVTSWIAAQRVQQRHTT